MTNKGKLIAAAELAAVFLVTVAAFVWGKRAALIERGYTAYGGGVYAPPDPGHLLHRETDPPRLDRGATGLFAESEV